MRLPELALAFLAASCGRSGDAPPKGSAPRAAASAAASATASATASAGHYARVLDAGREPRALLSFAFVPGRVEAATLDLESRIEREGAALGEERVQLELGVRYTSKDTVELTLVRAETTTPTVPRIESTKGARFVQKFYPSGETELPEVTFPEGSDAHAADYVRGAVIQVASNLLPVVPKVPIGEGARWAHEELRYSLVAPPGKMIAVERRSGIDGVRRLATGETVYAKEEQTYRIEAPPDGIARHVEAVLVAAQPGGAILTTRIRLDVTSGS